MKIKKFIILLTFTAVLVVLQGCNPGNLPRSYDAYDAFRALEDRSREIEDFSGTASVTVSLRGRSELSAPVYPIRYVAPGNLMLTIRGFAGIVGAMVGIEDDLASVYIPSENIYWRTGKGENPLEFILPGMNISAEKVSSLFGVTVPPAMDGFHISLDRKGRNRAVLTLTGENSVYTYTIGQNSTIIEETIFEDGQLIWRKRASEFITNSGVRFPRKLNFEFTDGRMEVNFSRISINRGMDPQEAAIIIPSSAKRVWDGIQY